MNTEKRKQRRKILDFEEFPLYAEFMSGVQVYFYGHIQNVSPNGLCIMLLNCTNASPPNTKGILRLIYMGKSIEVVGVVKWVDTPSHLIRFAGIETPKEDLYKKLYDLNPTFFNRELKY